MGKMQDKTGVVGYNNFGSKMIVSRYNGVRDIDVYFPDYDWTYKNTNFSTFKKGYIACPYEKRYFGVGYLGEGDISPYENSKSTKCFNTWMGILERCYDDKCHERQPAYENCEVCEEWYCFQNFAKWYEKNYYEISNQRMCLDKDILVKGNKIYSPETCVFVNNEINVLFTNSKRARGEYPVGVDKLKKNNKFRARCSIYKDGKKISMIIGNTFTTPEEAFYAYKRFKETRIKEIADKYESQIPKQVYEAMYNWEVEITD